MPKLTADLVREFLTYDPETGRLWWKFRDVKHFATERAAKAWNTRYAGKEAFTASAEGYKVGRIFDTMQRANRVAWAIMTGEWPSGDVDHKNRDRSDNTWVNLEDKTHEFNSRNQGVRSNNTSGVKGVKWNAASGKWRAEIHVDGKSKHLGLFTKLEDAAKARAYAEQAIGGYHP